MKTQRARGALLCCRCNRLAARGKKGLFFKTELGFAFHLHGLGLFRIGGDGRPREHIRIRRVAGKPDLQHHRRDDTSDESGVCVPRNGENFIGDFSPSKLSRIRSVAGTCNLQHDFREDARHKCRNRDACHTQSLLIRRRDGSL